MKDMPDLSIPLDYDALEHSPSIRDQEYLSHSSLLGSILGNYGKELYVYEIAVQQYSY